MKELIERNYAATVKRGLINENTEVFIFLEKAEEELRECIDAYYYEGDDRYAEELIDLASVCFNQIKNMGLDPIKEFEKVVIKNETRED